MAQKAQSHMEVDVPISTGKKGTPTYREGTIKLDLPTMSEDGLKWALEKFGWETVLAGFIKSHVIAEQAPARRALENGKASNGKKPRGVFAQLTS